MMKELLLTEAPIPKAQEELPKGQTRTIKEFDLQQTIKA
jgi:hypothetical protein